MSKYEFSLRQEVLMEQGASVLGDLFRLKRTHGVSHPTDSVVIMYELVWSAKQDILKAKTVPELDRIEGQFDLANQFISRKGFAAYA